MAIAATITQYLADHDIEYDVVTHRPTMTSMETAECAHVPGDSVAKSVILEDETGYIMAVIPATHRIKVGRLNKLMHRKLGLATEAELQDLFDDCDPGAIPAFGQAYDIETVWDDSLAGMPEIYFEAGDHEQLVRLSGQQFESLMHAARHGIFSSHI